MPLQPKLQLGPYEVIALIGAGGMGEVYEARDTRLDRKVAVKVLARLLDGTEVAHPGRSRLPPWRDEYLRFSRRVLAIKSRRRADRIDRLPFVNTPAASDRRSLRRSIHPLGAC